MAKFRRSIQPSGFRPEQVSERNISRLQEYSDRIIQSLREERDAVVSNRNNTAAALKENAQIEASQASANQKIQQQNIQKQIDEQKILSQQSLAQFEANTRASQTMFASFAKLSDTARAKWQEAEVEKSKKKFDNDLAEVMILGENSPVYKGIKSLVNETNAETVASLTEVAKAQEQGLDPLDADRYATNINQLSPGHKTGYLLTLAKQYNTYLTEQALIDETGVARNRTKAGEFASKALDDFMQLNGVKGITPGFLKTSGFLDAVLGVNQQFMNVAAKAEQEDNLTLFETNFNSSLANQPDAAAATAYLETQWPELVRRKGFEGALNYLEGLGKTIDSDGTPLYPTDAILAAKIGPNGEAYGDKWQKRKAQIQITLAQGANTIDALEDATKDREANQYVKDAILPSIRPLLAEAPASEDLNILATTEQQILEKTDGVLPKSWINFKKTVINQTKQESQRNSQLALAYLATGEPANFVKARELISGITDPETRTELLKQYNLATNPLQASAENKKILEKAITATSREILRQSLEGSSSNTALRLAGYLRTDVYKMYKEEYQATRDENLARANVLAKLDQEKVKALAGDPTARYRYEAGKFNQTVFPGLEAESKQTQAQKDARLNTIIDTVDAVGVNILDSPGLIPEKELRTASEAAEQGVFLNKIASREINALKKALTTKGKAVTYGEIYNRLINAHNKNNPGKEIRPLGISPMLQILDYSHQATLDAIANNPTTANVARGIAESSPGGKELRKNRRQFFSGNTGMSTGPHGDFRVRDLATGQYINPEPFLWRLTVNGKPLTQQFTMTSPFGMRTHPVTGQRKPHNGMDYAMPVGTPVDVNADFLERVYDPSGGGNISIYTFTENGRNYEMWALHGQ